MSLQKSVGVVAVLAAQRIAMADAVVVDSKSVIFDAGRAASTPALGGVLPPSITLPTGTGRYVEFTSVTGLVGFGVSNPPTPPTAPDGYDYPSGMDINSLNGISGMRGPRYAFLAGVFLDDNLPGGSGPARLDFGVVGFGFASLSPSLHQTFYVGDGLTGTGAGSIQRFFVPDGATRLFLGILDAGGVVGDPGMYSDNFGSFTANLNAVPAPGAAGLLLGCFSLMGRRSRR